MLDLVHTFAVRPQRPFRGDYADVIREFETYRLPLLAKIRDAGFIIVLLTARSQRYRDVTLANIYRHTGWQPEFTLFNTHELSPPDSKRRALHEVLFPMFGADPSRYFALESNSRTRAMYASEKIEAITREYYLGEVPEQLPLFGCENAHSVNQSIDHGNA